MNKDSLFVKAKEYYNKSLYCEAIELLDELIHNNPKVEEYYFYAGQCCENVFYEFKAIEYYLKGMKECFNSEYVSDYHLHIGNCYVRLSKINDAIFHYDESSKFNDNYIIAQFNKAKAFVCVKEYKTALDIFEQVKKEDTCAVIDNKVINDYVKYCQGKHM